MELGDVAGEDVALPAFIGLDQVGEGGELDLVVFDVVAAEVVGES